MDAPKLAVAAFAVAASLVCCTVSSVDDEGLSVDVGLAADPPANAMITSDLGYEIQLVSGFVAIASVEVGACDGEQASIPLWRRLLAIPEAHAHSTSSPTKLGVPGVLPLVPTAHVEDDLGSILPPPGRYCFTDVALGPADGDAVLLPADGAMVGLTLEVEGTWVAPGGGEAVPFAWTSTATPSARHGTAFSLREAGPRTARLELEVDVATIFDGIDLATVDASLGADRVAARVADTLHIAIQ